MVKTFSTAFTISTHGIGTYEITDRISAIVRTWIANKALAVEIRRGPDRHEHEYLIVGPWTDNAHDSPDTL